MDIIYATCNNETLISMVKHIARGNNQPSLKFFDHKTGKILLDIWDKLERGLWSDFSIDNALYNDSIGEVRQDKWKYVLPNLTTINPGFVWDYNSNTLKEELYKPNYTKADINSFLNKVHEFFYQFENKRIGVHLSGGFDSGLIICLLKYFHIPFVAVGLYSDRFEFRTEHRIQEILADYADDAVLIDFEDYPFYANLDKKPKHQVPDANIKMLDASTAVAETFASKGCDVVFSGQGGDTLFVDDIDWSTFRGYNIGNEFLFPWEQDFIYKPLGIELISIYSDTNIIDQVTSLRSGQPEDPLKLWARHFFRKFLPVELAEFTYASDFFGLSMDGLNQAKPHIKSLFEEAHDYIKHPIFAPAGIRDMMKIDVFSLEYRTYCALCTKISIATWLHSLFRKDD